MGVDGWKCVLVRKARQKKEIRKSVKFPGKLSQPKWKTQNQNIGNKATWSEIIKEKKCLQSSLSRKSIDSSVF